MPWRIATTVSVLTLSILMTLSSYQSSYALTADLLAVVHQIPGQPATIRIFSDAGQLINDISVSDSPGVQINSPAWSPDGTKLAYMKDGYAYIIDADGSNPTQISHTIVRNIGDWDPRFIPNPGVTWSPDGLKLAYTTENRLFTINIDSTNERSIHQYTADGSVSWHGDEITAWYYNGLVEYGGVVPVNENGTPKGSIYNQYFYYLINSKQSARSHDGSKYITPAKVSSTPGDTIHMINSDGTDLREVASQPANYTGNYQLYPSWSPNDKKIAYVAEQGMFPFHTEFYIKTLETGVTQTLDTYESGSIYTQSSWQVVANPSLYRLVNWKTHERLFTTNKAEVFSAQRDYPGWIYEGVAMRMYTTPTTENKAVYRLANSITNERLFTINHDEIAFAQNNYAGWVYEGIPFYASKNDSDKPVYRLANYITNQRLFTTSYEEISYAQNNYPGWVYEGIAFRAAN